jgi:hypothetical protein
VFVGPVSYLPNRKAIEYIVNVFAVLLLEHFPNLVIHLYGSGTESYQAINVRGFGYVADELQIYRRDDLHIAPVNIASGVLNKVSIPLALGLRVVTTELASNGIKKSSNLFVSHGIDDFFEKFLEAKKSKINPSSKVMTNNIPNEIRQLMLWSIDNI